MIKPGEMIMIPDLHRQGLSVSAIARESGFDRMTVRRYIERGSKLSALGHEVKLMPPAYVKPYVKRGKNDAVNAEANLRGGHAVDDALCSGHERKATIDHDASSFAGPPDPATHDARQHVARTPCRARDCRGTRAP